jgi:hypothetical protein
MADIVWPNRDPLGDVGFVVNKRNGLSDNIARQIYHQTRVNQKMARIDRGFVRKLKVWEANSGLLLLDIGEANVYTFNSSDPVDNYDQNGDITLVEGVVGVLILAIIAEGLYDAWERSHNHQSGFCPAPPPPPPDDPGDDPPERGGPGEGNAATGPAAP